MLRSMYSGVAGLKVHQTRMDVIGNNIANVNTTAYKYQSINFSDVMYQTSQNASGATATTGGVNARQVGLGAIQAAISTAIDQEGATQTTNNPFDLRISGSSFFIVNDGSGPKYTRDGSFYIDGEGNLAMQSTGYYVLGWGTQTNPDTGELTINKNGGLDKLALNTKEVQTYPPEATGAGVFSANIDKNDVDVTSTAGKIIQYEFYDNMGYVYTASFKLNDVRTQVLDGGGNPVLDANNNPIYNITPNQYTMELTDITDSNGVSIKENPNDPNAPFTFDDLGISFGENGNNIVTLHYNERTGDYLGHTRTEGGTTSVVDKTSNPEDYQMIRIRFDPRSVTDANKQALVAAMGGLQSTLAGADASVHDIELDFSTTTNTNTDGRATIKSAKGNLQSGFVGRRVGAISGINVAADGKITASYTNGQTRLLGQIAAAQFANASGLEKEGENLYAATLNSGEATVMDVSEDGGKMNTGVLEMSNVDLSNEFTSMITAQRGFQANSRIITVSDTLLEELTNLKR